eukprot:TRINITY_DN3977_c0_g1_i2.p1 TRINITY_DN3977_c0_g1~~TRINITY_DN3977_c0_g1_i2.p1  ORF type:complete len:146 (-),score=45.68 TRINITY_DN3977_c0_g1_i2:3-440(-)
MASSSSYAAAPPPPPPPPKESFARRYKFVWPVLLTVNLALGAYLFMRTRKKGPIAEGSEVAAEVPSAPLEKKPTTVLEKPLPEPPITQPVKVRQPIPVEEQHQLFKWILDEKRKQKPANPSEKKRIDEEKAILKQFVRAKSIPTL